MQAAKDEVKDKLPTMLQNLDNEIEDLKKKILNTTTQINSGKLIQEDTPPVEALEKLKEIFTKNIENY